MHHQESRRNFIRLSSVGFATGLFSVNRNESQPRSFLTIPSAAVKKLNIVCMGAHPGDPEFGCGGTMAKYSDAGHSVTFLYLTRGEAGDPKKSHEESAALRTHEAETACRILNVVPRFAGQIDGDTVLSNTKTQEMMNLLSEMKPDVVFTQWPVDSHMDHQVTGQLGISCWVKMQKQFDLFFYEVNTGTETMAFTPTEYVDITSVRQKKINALNAHQTQDPVNTYNTFFKQMEDFRGLETRVKAAEAFVRLTNKLMI